jgi:hypothetical protein
MSAPRLATIPFEHIEAEMAAFPIVSETSFRRGVTSLNPLVSGDDALWRAAERELVGALPSLPLDEASAIRDKLWFDSSSLHQGSNKFANAYQTVSLVSYVRRLAENYVDIQGRPIVEATGADGDIRERAGAEGRLRWSWMCQAFPPDLLRVARGVVDPDANPFCLNPNVDTMLRDFGFAETHLHLGAAIDFSLVWAALMRSLAGSESNHCDFESPGACFNDGRDLSGWLMYAAVARLVLAEWLNNGLPSKNSLHELTKFSRDRPDVRLDVVECQRLAVTLSGLRNGRWQGRPRPRFAAEPSEHLAKRFAQTRAIYRRLIRPPDLLSGSYVGRRTLRALQEPESRHDVFGNDPLAKVVGWRPTEGASPETLFVETALLRIEEDERKGLRDTDFSRLFWQIMRVRCLLYRHVVQRPLTPGLQWFVRFFTRIKALRKNLSNSVLASTAARITGAGAGLRSLEVRLGTDKSELVCLDLIRDLEKSALPQAMGSEFRFFRTNEKTVTAEFEVGGVFHFSRKRGGGWEAGKPNAFGLDNSFPGSLGIHGSAGAKRIKHAGNPTGFRFARFYMEQRSHAQALVSVFQKYPFALRTVRGVDLCTDEAGVPLWVMAPLVRWVREAGQQASIHLKRRGAFAIPPLRTSVHAGEDFIHLMAGLRRIDNTITYLGLQEGDRLGHALALGIDAASWCSSTGRVVQTREERLFDLVWEWSCYAKHSVDVTSKRLAYVRSEIVRLARHIFEADDGQSYAPEDLAAFWDLLHTDQALRDAGFPDQAGRLLRKQRDDLHKDSGEVTRHGQRMLYDYLCNKEVWRRGRVLETIDLRNLKHESGALAELQKCLKQRIGKLCVTIEVNPSSNLLIGDLIDFKNHPLWRMRPVAGTANSSPLSICIGSDNPLTFATTLPHEYQLLFDAIVLGEETHEVAVKWIDEVREAGMRARFTLAPEVAQISQSLRVPNLMRLERPGSPP